jgi:hypothetical protein
LDEIETSLRRSFIHQQIPAGHQQSNTNTDIGNYLQYHQRTADQLDTILILFDHQLSIAAMKFGKFFSKKRGGNVASKPEDIGATAVKIAMVENDDKVEISEASPEAEDREESPITVAGISKNASHELAKNNVPFPAQDASLSHDEMREEPPSCDPTEELVVEISQRDTASSYDSGESYDEEDITYFDNATLSVVTPNQQLGLRMGEKKTNYFHKDVVVSSLDVGMIGLVLRAMYFIPKPCASDHVVLKVDVSTVSFRQMMEREKTVYCV